MKGILFIKIKKNNHLLLGVTLNLQTKNFKPSSKWFDIKLLIALKHYTCMYFLNKYVKEDVFSGSSQASILAKHTKDGGEGIFTF